MLLPVNIEISEDKKATVGNIATTIKGLGIESKITEQIIQTTEAKKTFKPINNVVDFEGKRIYQ